MLQLFQQKQNFILYNNYQNLNISNLMYRSPLIKPINNNRITSSIQKQEKRVPTAPLKTRPKPMMLAINQFGGIGKQRLSALVEKIRDHPHQIKQPTKQKSKIQIISLPKAQNIKYNEKKQYDYFNKKVDQDKRPQTSKGARRKDKQSQSEYHEQEHEDLIILNGLKQELPKSQIRKKPVTRIIFSAQYKKPKVKQLDEIIKCNNASLIKKSNSQVTAPFQTSIGTQFLSLFANR